MLGNENGPPRPLTAGALITVTLFLALYHAPERYHSLSGSSLPASYRLPENKGGMCMGSGCEEYRMPGKQEQGP